MKPRVRLSIITAALAVLALAAPLEASGPAPLDERILAKLDSHPQRVRITALNKYNSVIARSSRAKQSKAQNISLLTATFLQYDVDGTPGITDGDGEILLSINKASRRAQELSKSWAKDLDGDFHITEAELEQFHSYKARAPLRSQGLYLTPSERQIASILDEKVTEDLRLDLNGDRILTWDELVADFDKRSDTRHRYVDASQVYRLFPHVGLLDLDGDLSVSVAEFADYAATVLDLADVDGDTVISREEQRAFRDAMRKISRR